MGFTLTPGQIESRYGHHPPTDETLPMHQMVRSMFKRMAQFLEDTLPEGRCKSLAHTELEVAAMWANKAVAEQAPLQKD